MIQGRPMWEWVLQLIVLLLLLWMHSSLYKRGEALVRSVDLIHHVTKSVKAHYITGISRAQQLPLLMHRYDLDLKALSTRDNVTRKKENPRWQ